MNLLILGAGGHGQVVREVAEATGDYQKIAFLDDRYSSDDDRMSDGARRSNLIGKLSDHKSFTDQFTHAFVAIGNPEVRKKYLELLDGVFEIATLIHPAATVSPTAFVDSGSVVMAGAVIQTGVRIRKGCIISAGAVVDHDATVGEYSHINAGAVIPSITTVPAMTKVDYGQVYHNIPKADTDWADEHKQQFGTEPSFF